MTKHRQSQEYKVGVTYFLDFAYSHASWDGRIYCPCHNCVGMSLLDRSTVKWHLERYGILQSYTTWVDHGEEFEESITNKRTATSREEMEDMITDGLGGISRDEGEEPNAEARTFYKLLEDCEKGLYPGCVSYNKMSFLVELLHLKAMYKVSNKFADELLRMLSKVLPPENTVPKSYYEAKKFISGLGLDYQKIHACVNDCILFRNEYVNLDACPICGESRWFQGHESAGGMNRPKKSKQKGGKLPVKVL